MTIKPFEADSITFSTLEPGPPQDRALPGYDRSILGRRAEFRFNTHPVDTSLVLEKIAHERLPEMTFHDAAGRWWRRNGQGRAPP